MAGGEVPADGADRSADRAADRGGVRDGARDAEGGWPSLRLAPGGRCRLSEAEWFHFLESGEPLHQWGPAFLLDERTSAAAAAAAGAVTPGVALVRLYARDDSGAGRHTCLRLDAAASHAARRGALRLEVLSRQAADVITAMQAKTSLSLLEMEAQDAASRRLAEAAEALYRELMRA